MNPRTKDTKDPLKLVRSGMFALNRKKWSKARRKFEAALTDEEMQRNAGLWANYGIALTNLKQLSKAREAFTRAVSLNKKNSELWVKKGLIEFKLDDYKPAVKSFEHAKRLDKKDPEIPILLSRAHRKNGDIKKGIKVLEAAKKELPESHQIPIELALVWNEQNEDLKAENILKKSIQTVTHPDPGLLLGQALLDKKEYKGAIIIYEELSFRFPQSPHAKYGLGVAYHANRKWSKALDAYKQALPLFRPKKPPQSLFTNMARTLKNLDRRKEAIDTLYQAKKYGKPTLEIALLLSELFLEDNRPDRAKRVLEDAVRLDKYNPGIYFYLGMTLLQLKDIKQAKENFQRTLELDPDFHESKLQLALLSIRENDLTTAFTLANQVATADKKHLPGNRLAAKLAFDLQKFRRTVEILQPIVETQPTQIDDLELLLKSWLLLSQPEKAKSFLDGLIKDHKELKKQLQSRSFFAQFQLS